MASLGELQKRAYRHSRAGGKPVPLDSRLRGNDVALIVGEISIYRSPYCRVDREKIVQSRGIANWRWRFVSAET